VGSTELVTYILFVFNHPLISERRTVETGLEKDRRLQLVQVRIVFLLEMASATTAAPALFRTCVPSEPTAW
jgi:hypothetical protein